MNVKNYFVQQILFTLAIMVARKRLLGSTSMLPQAYKTLRFSSMRWTSTFFLGHRQKKRTVLKYVLLLNRDTYIFKNSNRKGTIVKRTANSSFWYQELETVSLNQWAANSMYISTFLIYTQYVALKLELLQYAWSSFRIRLLLLTGLRSDRQQTED